jgi:ribonuclease HI
MELLEHVVDFEKRSAVKSQIIIHFIADWTESNSYTKGQVPESPWLIYCDRAWGSVGAGASAILISPSAIKLRYAKQLQFTKEIDKYTIIEYEAILLGLRKLRAIGVQRCILKIDSKVVSSQIEKECIAREPYLALVRRMENYFKGFRLEYIERKNSEADELANAAA